LSCYSAAGVDNHILPASGAGRDEALVPLVEAGYENCAQDRDVGPAQRPVHMARCGQGGAPRAEEQEAQDGVADDVACLANIEMPNMKAGQVQAEEEMQQWIENPASVAGGEQGGRFNGDDNEPEDCGDPRLQKIAPVGVQSGRAPAVVFGLLDAVVGSLAGDHDVVDVTFAESGATDAHEARLLQEFCDGRAAAVTHA
jgi:hypothetical protein